MTNHPNRSRARLAEYEGRLRTIDGATVVELVGPNDNARRRFQYRRAPDGGIERRVLRADGSAYPDTGSPWERLDDHELAQMRETRVGYHPILDPLGL